MYTNKWCLRWESNPQNSASKTDMYANSITKAKKWCSKRDSNSQQLLPQSSVFTNFTIRAKSYMVPTVGIEPTVEQILSLLCLPIPPRGHNIKWLPN